MNGKLSLYLIILLFTALFVGPSLLLQGPRKLHPGQSAIRLTVEQGRLLDSLNSGTPAQKP